MRPLSKQELYALLEHHSPEEIRAIHSDQLDATWHAYLAKWTADIQKGTTLLTHFETEYQALDAEDPLPPMYFLPKNLSLQNPECINNGKSYWLPLWQRSPSLSSLSFPKSGNSGSQAPPADARLT